MGAAIGDALGRITEFIDTTAEIEDVYGTAGITSFRSFLSQDWVIDPETKKKCAAYSDDTVLSLVILKQATQDRLALSATEHTGSSSQAASFVQKSAIAFAHLFGPNRYEIDPLFDLRLHGPTNIKASEELAYLAFSKKAPQNPLWFARGRVSLKDYCQHKDPYIEKEGGCGSVMRAWPVGLVYWDNEERAQLLAYQQSALTHRHPMALAASVALAVGVAHAVRRYDKGQTSATHNLQKESVGSIVQAMIQAAEQFDAAELVYKTKAKKWLPTNTYTPALLAQDKILTSDLIRYAAIMATTEVPPARILGTNNNLEKNYRSPNGFLLGWAADEALAAAVYIFVRHPDNIKSALAEAVNTPGDSDSIASLVGALVGARIGFKAFEKQYQCELLENVAGLKAAAANAYKAASTGIS